MPPNPIEVQLIAEQLKHALDLQKAQADLVKVQLDHDREINTLKFEQLKSVDEVQLKRLSDHETRLRDVTAGVIQSRFFIGLVGASILLSAFALIKTFFF
jgi:hypothetical protein